MAELKKCMCGKAPTFVGTHQTYEIQCSCGMAAKSITAWNTRPLEDALAGALEKIKDCAKAETNSNSTLSFVGLIAEQALEKYKSK